MAQSPIHYTVRFPDLHTHTAHIQACFFTAGLDELTLTMAVWTPGSYMVREYAKHVEQIRAYNTDTQQPLPLRKTHKNQWLVECQGARSVDVEYVLYGREMTVRTNWISEEHTLLNGAATFITAQGMQHHPHHVCFAEPFKGPHIQTSLPETAAHTYAAKDYDTLVDSPFLLGDLYVHTRMVDGVEYRCAYAHATEAWTKPHVHNDIAQLVQTQHRFWGVVPFEKYCFLTVLSDGKGGLEHASSSVLMTPPQSIQKREHYVDWLGLVSHELFHAWNIKRLRPIELGPFDYNQENFTPSLWIAEGFTAYYDDLLVQRAGLSSTSEYLERLSRNVEQVHTHEGHRIQSLTDASWDAWIKFYRRDENSNNSTVSYYAKGALVGFLCDIALRAHTRNTVSLDTVMHKAYTLYAEKTGYTHTEFVQLLLSYLPNSYAAVLEQALHSTQPLDFTPALEWLGVCFKPHDTGSQKPFWGLKTTLQHNAVTVSEVQRNGPACKAGLQSGDELLAIHNVRTTAASFDDDLKNTPAHQPALVLLNRKGRILTRTLTPADPPTHSWKLVVSANATDAQKKNMACWLKGSFG
jgi:predicted metalloprotease with PDZ domain